jgi:tRNA A-37 threonylcarbamoyl transferase component Bud32
MKNDFITMGEGYGNYQDIVNQLSSITDRYSLLKTISSEDLLRNQKHKTVFRIKTNNVHIFVKIWWDFGILRFVKDTIKKGKRGIREANGLKLLNKNGLKTPPLIAYGQVVQTSLNGFSFVITEEVKGALTLDQLLIKENDFEIVKQASIALYNVHNKGLVYGDFNYENFLIDLKDPRKHYYLDWLAVKKTTNQHFKLKDVAIFMYEVEAHINFDSKQQINSIFLDEYLRLAKLKDEDKTRNIILSELELLKKRRSFYSFF